MKDPREVIIRPIVTEHSYDQMENNVYTFEVAKDSNKVEIRQAIEAIFNVSVVKVNTLNVKPKPKRVRYQVGQTRTWKKAMVTLKEGDTIELFGANEPAPYIPSLMAPAGSPELPPISWIREMGGPFMAGNALYDVGLRLRAAELYDMGRGRASIAALLGIPEETVRKWLDIYRSAGIEVLAMMGKKHAAYSFETKLAAVRAVVDEGMTKPEAMAKFGIASPSSLKKWLKAYREEGPEALGPKPKGRPKGSGSPTKEMTREQELERRVRKLEAENAYLKKSIALKAEKRSRTERKRLS